MKKYFLLVLLMTVVFLGKSVVMAQSVDEWNTICGVTTITEDNLGSVRNLDNGTCCTEDGAVIEGLSACTASELGEGNSCTSPVGSVSNGLRCVCPDAGGIKQIAVDGVCKKCNAEDVCCGIKLNTKVPFIGNCIESKKDYVGGNSETGVTGEEAFPVLMGSLTQILVTVILIVSFLLIVAGGIMIATGDPSGGKKMIIKVVIGIAILGASGVILRLINPNFFG